MNFNYFVGIDVSKATLDMCLIHLDQKVFSMTEENSNKGLNLFWKKILASLPKRQLSEVVFCMEHTGIYNNIIVEFLRKKKVAICLENPVHIKFSMGLQRGKNDSVDAERIARYASKENRNLRIWDPPREIISQLKHLTALRTRMIDCRKSLVVPLNELKKFDKTCSKLVESHSNPLLKKLDEALKRVEESILDIIKRDATLKPLFEITTSVSGVGPITAAAVIIYTNEFKSIQNAQKFACYSGVAPFEHRSGTSVRGKSRISHKANKGLKTLLHMGAMNAIVHSPDMKSYYDRKIKEGKNKMSVINAVRNKIIHRIFACVRERRTYQKNYTEMLA